MSNSRLERIAQRIANKINKKAAKASAGDVIYLEIRWPLRYWLKSGWPEYLYRDGKDSCRKLDYLVRDRVPGAEWRSSGYSTTKRTHLVKRLDFEYRVHPLTSDDTQPIDL